MASKRKPMEPQQLSLENLKDLDNGMLRSQFDGHVRDAMLNCTDYPSLKGKRKITIDIELEPTADANGAISGIEASYSVKHTTPKAKSRTLVLEVEETRDSRGLPISKAYFTPASGNTEVAEDARKDL